MVRHDVLGNPESLGNRYVGSCLALAVCIFINVFFFLSLPKALLYLICARQFILSAMFLTCRKNIINGNTCI